MNDVTVQSWINLLIVVHDFHLIDICVNCTTDLGSQLKKCQVGWNFDGNFTFVYVKMIDDSDCNHLSWEK